MKDANASGILWFESRDSLGSILQTEIEYQTVVTESKPTQRVDHILAKIVALLPNKVRNSRLWIH